MESRSDLLVDLIREDVLTVLGLLKLNWEILGLMIGYSYLSQRFHGVYKEKSRGV